MRIFKKKEKASEEPTPQMPTPHEIGLKGTVEDFYTADRAAKEDIVAKKAVSDESLKKWRKALFRNRTTYQAYEADEQAYKAAQKVPAQLREEFNQGAREAFLDNRPDNIQHILSDPADFLPQFETRDSYVAKTLVKLLSQSANADTVLDAAHEKVAEDEKPDTLGRALLWVVSLSAMGRQMTETDIEKCVSALLKGDADAGFQANEVLAMAFHQDAPAGVINMLLEKGARVDEALQEMYRHPGYYGSTPKKVEDLEHRKNTDAEIRILKETIAELTGKKQDAVAPAPANRLKISTPAR